MAAGTPMRGGASGVGIEARQRHAAGLPPACRALLDRLDWLLPLPSPFAPGFVFLAGSLDGHGIGGGGTELEAGQRAAGETAELLVQLAPPPDCDLPLDGGLAAFWRAEGPSLAAALWPGGAPVGAPAASLHRALPLPDDAPPRGLGLAAGPDRDAARRAALLELAERDAAAAWWIDGRRPRAVEAALAAPAAALLAEFRLGAEVQRPTGFLDLGGPVPVFAAFSTDADGAGLAVGLKAGAEPEAALKGAVTELLQMELALAIARRRAADGKATGGDRAHLARAALSPAGFSAFRADPPRPIARLAPTLDAVATALSGRGPIAFHDAEAGGLAVAKAFAPGLRPLPGDTTPPASGTPGALARLI